MKLRSVIGLILPFLFLACTTPADYCETIIRETSKTETNMLNLGELIGKKEFSEVQSAFDEAKEEAEESLEKLQSLKPMRGDDALRTAGIDFVQAYVSLYNEEYKEAIEILKNAGNFSYEDGAKLSKLEDGVAEKLGSKKSILIKEFKSFVQKYGLQITN
ncbi:MAG: hypothetical protein J6R59_09315 [Paludibacteraceae bacterium]|jgi:arginyl-tRNA synthetase|nr:hypothetical protein [Paludibacteraceae bacterium]